MSALPFVEPFHCRTDRGRALARLAHRPGTNRALLQFNSGEVYLVTAVYDQDFWWPRLSGLAPGCWFNMVIRKRPGFSATRLDTWPADDLAGWNEITWNHSGEQKSP